ncbi:SDR family oxidoreductase [Mesorhizobium sp. M7A.F.Ca.US.006.01.1.1]|uniref:SDR family NAD(P)-dependent oxidoreductase n=1 Tax=Mesorhizobium sp. M7A.F.Ca.US.006.01.1.1 TaxID=2496707 RepID=UPI000FCBA9C2|nr:SDR family oxidoreductase [Mesorhizobium sp. M7A.F.Ca.US.006.01.1.1]RUZ81397.1 SDR family oxidoreductase [Mesorhizobium sp. M7A.F.Ca.US.006.01.1.1]
MDLPQTPSFRLDGRRALVTGATSGIGMAAAVALAAAGAAVTIAARSEGALVNLVGAFADRGWDARHKAIDVADVHTVHRWVASELPFDILVNSAGVARHSAALDATPEDYDAVMAINVRGAFFLTQAVAGRLIEVGRPGSLINVSSQMGHVGGQDRAVYCASKFAVEGFTKAMAIEWGKFGIRVNTVCPTFIRTPLTEGTFVNPERRKWIEDKIKLGRVGELPDIMGPVLFLASDASALVTGTAQMVDGGWTAD